MKNEAPYRIFYWKHIFHDDDEYFLLENAVVNDYTKFDNRDIYYLTDCNGNVIIDNRLRDNGRIG